MRLTKSELKYLRSLSQKKVRDTEKKFLVEGWRAIKDAINSTFKIEFSVVLTKHAENADYRNILDQLQNRGSEIKYITEPELRQIADTIHSQGIVALVHQKKYEIARLVDKTEGFHVIADAIADPGNIGSIIRTADWFGADSVLLGNGCVELYNEKVVRSTAGSIFHIPIVEQVRLNEILHALKKSGYFVAATAARGKIAYTSLERKSRMAVVFGSEANGVQKEVQDLADVTVRIPKMGKAESLNVGVACGIVLAHLSNAGRT